MIFLVFVEMVKVVIVILTIVTPIVSETEVGECQDQDGEN